MNRRISSDCLYANWLPTLGGRGVMRLRRSPQRNADWRSRRITLPLLVDIADLLANGSQRLDRAESAARRALELLATVRAPLRITPDEWTAVVSKLRARAHGALGLVRFKRDDTAGAIKEFEAALAETAGGDPLLHYRLGRLYAVSGRTADARSQLQKAVHSGNKVLRERAQAALAALQ